MLNLHKHSPDQAHGGIRDQNIKIPTSNHHRIPALFAQRFFCFFSSKEKKEAKGKTGSRSRNV
jgi:hypothetical protein